jgi:hypothetical protein
LGEWFSPWPGLGKKQNPLVYQKKIETPCSPKTSKFKKRAGNFENWNKNTRRLHLPSKPQPKTIGK